MFGPMMDDMAKTKDQDLSPLGENETVTTTENPNDITHLSRPLARRLAEIAVHAYSLATFQPGRSAQIDRAMVMANLDDPEVVAWVNDMSKIVGTPTFPSP